MIPGYWIATKGLCDWHVSCLASHLLTGWRMGWCCLEGSEECEFSPFILFVCFLNLSSPHSLYSYHSYDGKLNQHQGCSILAVSCLKWSAILLEKAFSNTSMSSMERKSVSATPRGTRSVVHLTFCCALQQMLGVFFLPFKNNFY